MEQIRNSVDGETYDKLIAQKFNNASLLLLEDADLVEMGITAKGPRKIILSVAEKLRANESERQDEGNESAHLNPQGDVRTMLIQDSKFRLIVQNVLDHGLIPKEADIHVMVRIICKPFEDRIYTGRGYPTTAEQWNLAKSVVKTFPQLSKTRVNNQASAESAFFWLHSGREHGDHSGYIYHRVRNAIKPLPKHKKKFNRTQSTRKPDSSIPTPLMELSQSVIDLIPDLANKVRIQRVMVECHPILELLLNESSGVIGILETLPHLRSYGGEMIHQAFYRLNPDVEQDLDFTPVTSKGLLLTTNLFNEVEDVHLRGFLRIFARLHRKGTGRRYAAHVNDLSNAELVLAAPLMQWSTNILENIARTGEDDCLPAIICEAETFKRGLYYIAFEGVEIARDSSIRRIFDLYLKCFKVFGIKVPTRLRMLHDVFSILVYKTMDHSSRKAVNEVCGFISEAAQAELD